MTSKIRVLPDSTINKIAAGEVIENPASVVKELIENSLDAQATEITVEVKTGGRQLIRISDNGIGMSMDDALLCLERHATSKIRQVEDIEEISSLGFRGEAIPSIASISKFILITRQEQHDEGTMVIVEGGRIIKNCPAERTPGTTIEVKSLFFNVPVRRKFQRSPAYDQGEIFKTLSLAALGHPHVRFQMIADQKSVLVCPFHNEQSTVQNIQKRIATVMGKDFVANTIPLSCENSQFRLMGMISTPNFHRPNRTGQHLFINQRPIWSSLVSSSIREGYNTTLPENRFPTFVLHLNVPGTLVDVNVHPRKREVRLRLEKELQEFIRQEISKKVQEIPQQTENDFFSPQPTPKTPISYSSTPVQKPQWNASNVPVQTRIAPQQLQQSQLLPNLENTVKILSTIEGFILIDPKTLPTPSKEHVLAIIDQRAAHAKVLFDQLRSKAPTPLKPQTLLIPLTLELNTIEATQLRNQLSCFDKLGIIIREKDDHTFVVEAFPQFLKMRDIKTLVHDMLNELNEHTSTHIPIQEQEKQITTAIAKSAIPRSQKLTQEEAQALLEKLMQCQSPFMGLFGQPTITFLTKEELTNLFNRKQSNAFSL